MNIPTLSGRAVALTRHRHGLYSFSGPGVTGYRFHGGAALAAARAAADRDAPADKLVSRIPRGPIVVSVLTPDASRHKREAFPSAHRETVRRTIETIVLQAPPAGWLDSRYSDARYRAIARRADAEMAYRRAWTLAQCQEGRLPYCCPMTAEHTALIHRLAETPTRVASQAGDSTSRRRAHDARKRAATTADDGADADLLALRAAAAKASGGADAFDWRMPAPARIPLSAHPTR